MNEKGFEETSTAKKSFLSGKKGLLVDDDSQMIDILSKYFATEGCYTEKALDGKLALEKMNNNRFDFILCDVNMPGMDGVTFYHQLKGIGSPYLDKVIFITGDTVDHEIQEFLKSINNPLLNKPFGLDDVKEAIRRLMANS
jgi:two-component system chemotaxis response regulator CheY